MKNFYVSFLTVLITAGIVVFTLSGSETAIESEDLTAYDHIQKSGVLRCGYVVYPPAIIKDPNTGALSGVMVEIVEEAAKRLNWSVEWTVETSFAEYAEELHNSKFDAMCGSAWPISGRAHKVSFAKPLWYSGIGAWVAQSNSDLNSTDQLNSPDITVSAIDGTIPFYLAQEQFPQATVLSIPPLSDYTLNMLNVENGKADVTFVELYQGNDYLSRNPNSLRNIAAKPLTIYANSISVKRGERDLIDVMNIAFDELINSGYIHHSVDRYDQFGNSFIHVK